MAQPQDALDEVASTETLRMRRVLDELFAVARAERSVDAGRKRLFQAADALASFWHTEAVPAERIHSHILADYFLPMEARAEICPRVHREDGILYGGFSFAQESPYALLVPKPGVYEYSLRGNPFARKGLVIDLQKPHSTAAMLAKFAQVASK